MRRALFVSLTCLGLVLVAWLWTRSADDVAAPPPTAPTALRERTTATPADTGTAVPDEPATATIPSTAREHVATGHRVRGRLVQDGRPLADTPVRVFAGGWRPPQVDATTTDGDGRFAFAMPTERFFFVADGATVPHGWWSVWRERHAADWDLGDVQVPRGGGIDGALRDRHGRPIAAASVTAERGQNVPMADAPPPTTTTTTAEGTFRFDGLHPGGYTLRAHATGFSIREHGVQIHADARVPAELELWPVRRRTGFVFDWRGAPLAGARLACNKGGQVVTTDARGWFAIEDYSDNDALRVTAAGHVGDWVSGMHYGDEPERIQLLRAVTLRGVVHGTEGATTTVQVTRAPDATDEAAPARPFDLIDKPLPVTDDGAFAIVGLSTSDYLVQASTPGIGTSPPLRVALRGDAEIELAIAAGSHLRVCVQDEGGAPIAGAEVVVDPGIVEYPSLYGPDANDVRARILGSYRKQVTATANGEAMIARLPTEPFACAVRHADFLPDHRVLEAGDAPTELVFTLLRAGRVRGVVRGAFDGEHTRHVALWRAEDDERMAATKRPPETLNGYLGHGWQPLSVSVDAAGHFGANGLTPGVWRASLSVHNTAQLDKRPDELVGAVPIVDDGADLETVVEFTVAGGVETRLELDPPPLGTLRGRVLLRGAPCSGAQVFGTRLGWDDAMARVFGSIAGRNTTDWDDDLVRGWAPGQRVAADGSFTFRYRDAGRILLRVRHADGHATQPPIPIDLPAPGDSVHCTLELAAGAVHGRFALEHLPEKQRRGVQAVLYPMHKATADPSFSTDYVMAISWDCARIELTGDGRFAFDFLPDGDWLVRIQAHAFGVDPGPLWQRVVRVAGDLVDLGELTPTAKATTALRWRWPDGTSPRRIAGVWLHRAHADAAGAIWAGTFAAADDGVTLQAPPGRYMVTPFGAFGEQLWHFAGTWGLSGAPLAEPFALEIDADGAAAVDVATLRPLPPPEPKQPR